MKTFIRCVCGFALGWVMYMLAMMTTTYDGFPSLILQPVMAVFFSGGFVALALVAGLPLHIPKVKTLWKKAGGWVLLITIAAILVMLFNARLGLQTNQINPDTNQTVKVMNPNVWMVCFLLALFPVVNFPRKQDENLPEPAQPQKPIRPWLIAGVCAGGITLLFIAINAVITKSPAIMPILGRWLVPPAIVCLITIAINPRRIVRKCAIASTFTWAATLVFITIIIAINIFSHVIHTAK